MFLPGMPSWIYDNFWGKADFWDQWGFRIPYISFLFIYAAITIGFVELGIRFIKRFA